MPPAPGYKRVYFMNRKTIFVLFFGLFNIQVVLYCCIVPEHEFQEYCTKSNLKLLVTVKIAPHNMSFNYFSILERRFVSQICKHICTGCCQLNL
jgi:hypothetical protein